MTKFLTVDQPTQSAERRHGKYAPRKLDAKAPVSPTEFMLVVGAGILALYAVASIASSGWTL